MQIQRCGGLNKGHEGSQKISIHYLLSNFYSHWDVCVCVWTMEITKLTVDWTEIIKSPQSQPEIFEYLKCLDRDFLRYPGESSDIQRLHTNILDTHFVRVNRPIASQHVADLKLNDK